MIDETGCRRVLVAAGAEDRPVLGRLLAGGPLRGWEVRDADSFARARFLMQHDACDVILLDEGLTRREGWAGLPWLTARGDTPVLLLADCDPNVIAAALRAGAHQWLPRDLVLKNPDLLAAALERAARRDGPPRAARPARGGRDQVSRLVDLLWEAAPVHGQSRWLSQRHVLERLHEEAARAGRHGTPLSLVLAEVGAADGDGPWLTGETGERVAAAVRRSDVAGRYGPNGLLLLLPGTDQAGARVCCRRLRGLLQACAGRVQFGMACHTPALGTPQALLGAAEQRLEAVKRQPTEVPDAGIGWP